ncbi:MAG TPA: FAD-dependent oxidoreductase, partial [Solirubrobacteraceae bacterium]|nr:FAD-dependent oxidoreductase [Solirubrobacteraceae bacterium]
RRAPIAGDGVVGGAFAELDLRADPRVAAARVAAWLERRGARFAWGAAATEVAPPYVETTAGRVRADGAVVCPGPDLTTLFPEVFAGREGLTRCKLQMLRVAAPGHPPIGPSVVTGLSLLRYPAYAEWPAAEAVRARLCSTRPELLEAGVNLIVAQRPGGDLIVGDTHEYGLAVSPFGDERLDELLLGEARALLGTPRLDVLERWHGIYPVAPGDPLLVGAPRPGVRVATVVAGVGMTIGLGVAADVLDDLDGASAAVTRASGTPPLPDGRRPSAP